MLLFEIGFLEIKLVDVVDILMVSILLFNLYKLIRGGVALKIFVGILALYLTYQVVKATEMELLSAILGQFMEVGVLAAIILFQPEIRKFLILVGNSTDFKNFPLYRYFRSRRTGENTLKLAPIIEAMKEMGATSTGALIVLSKDDPLDFFADTGDRIDAEISKRILLSIFYKNSPLHDGAAIIHNNRIKAARCILPVTDKQNIPATMGLRHRAGIGMTESTNTVVLVVSEETGQMSFIHAGKIYHNLSSMEIRQKVRDYFSDDFKDESKISLKKQPDETVEVDS
ncbi:diadenylate cyclase CdaA [Limibacter armeniacum]|uniref:diadenylate cyclase CdaA n=1 Tax=Limibacter armeniacum TaxID=466084 RepID=UPI002FE5F308